jgi:hypothetical protein
MSDANIAPRVERIAELPLMTFVPSVFMEIMAAAVFRSALRDDIRSLED